VFGTHTPWGGEDHVPIVAGAETAVERRLSEQLMHAAEGTAIRKLRSGEYLFRQSARETSVALVLDGNLEVVVDGEVVGQVGPGTIVGERAALSAGQRTADLRALTDCRVAEVPADTLDAELLNELALGHHREGNST
jgi:CRP-like cAMP-binding protein